MDNGLKSIHDEKEHFSNLLFSEGWGYQRKILKQTRCAIECIQTRISAIYYQRQSTVKEAITESINWR
jgi:hypothetical protein